MNVTIYEAARKVGATRAEAELLAYYVEHESLKAAADAAGMTYGAASNHMGRLKRRLKVRHMAAVVSRLRAI